MFIVSWIVRYSQHDICTANMKELKRIQTCSSGSVSNDCCRRYGFDGTEMVAEIGKHVKKEVCML